MSKIHVSYNQIHTMVKETVDSMHLNEDFQPDIMGKALLLTVWLATIHWSSTECIVHYTPGF